LFHENGFRGNVEHYTDPLNSFLPLVLERHKGIPISLCLVYLLVAQRLGLDLEPVGIPGHFLVGCYHEDAPLFIDPFEQGAFRTTCDVPMYCVLVDDVVTTGATLSAAARALRQAGCARVGALALARVVLGAPVSRVGQRKLQSGGTRTWNST
jgi:hypothetical protein